MPSLPSSVHSNMPAAVSASGDTHAPSLPPETSTSTPAISLSAPASVVIPVSETVASLADVPATHSAPVHSGPHCIQALWQWLLRKFKRPSRRMDASYASPLSSAPDHTPFKIMNVSIVAAVDCIVLQWPLPVLCRHLEANPASLSAFFLLIGTDVSMKMMRRSLRDRGNAVTHSPPSLWEVSTGALTREAAIATGVTRASAIKLLQEKMSIAEESDISFLLSLGRIRRAKCTGTLVLQPGEDVTILAFLVTGEMCESAGKSATSTITLHPGCFIGACDFVGSKSEDAQRVWVLGTSTWVEWDALELSQALRLDKRRGL